MLAIAGLLLLGVVVLGLEAFVLFTSSHPAPLPEILVAQEEEEALAARWANFQHELTSRHPTPPFQVSARDLNVFISMMPRLRSRVYATIAGNRIQSQFTMALSSNPKSRFVNGTAAVEARIVNGEFKLDVTACRVNGRALPRWICRHLGRESLNPEAFGILKDSQILPHLRSIDARDDGLVLTPVICE